MGSFSDTRHLGAAVARIKELTATLAERDGGFTVDPHTGDDVTGGYAVAVHPESVAIRQNVTVGDLLEFTVTRAEVLALPGRVFGGWRDPFDGRVYLDVSILLPDLETAMRCARIHDQLAVWDFSTGRSIPTY